MEEKTHYFYGFLIASVVIIFMSMYHKTDLNYIWLLAGVLVTILVWEVANKYDRKIKRLRQDAGLQETSASSTDLSESFDPETQAEHERFYPQI